MREGDETITTSIASIMGSKDPDVSSSRVSKEQSKEAKDLNIDELADLNKEMRTYPRDMVWCSVCSGIGYSCISGFITLSHVIA